MINNKIIITAVIGALHVDNAVIDQDKVTMKKVFFLIPNFQAFLYTELAHWDLITYVSLKGI